MFVFINDFYLILKLFFLNNKIDKFYGKSVTLKERMVFQNYLGVVNDCKSAV